MVGARVVDSLGDPPCVLDVARIESADFRAAASQPGLEVAIEVVDFATTRLIFPGDFCRKRSEQRENGSDRRVFTSATEEETEQSR